MPYPVAFEADYVERRNRLTTFFRLILAIPALIFVYVFGIVAFIAIVIAWFAIVFTARYPAALFDFVAGYNRCLARVTAYFALLSDPYPPFAGSEHTGYPVRVRYAGPLDHYNRLKTLFRVILAIPVVILRYVMGLLLEIGAVAAWVVILITGKMPRGLFDVMVLANSYTARSDAYVFLLTETYPPFQDEQTRTAGVDAGPGSGDLPPAPSGALPESAPAEASGTAPASGPGPAPGDPPAAPPHAPGPEDPAGSGG
jgi:hypothetical protein